MDIQVLRALAVVAVVLNHLFPSRLVGGFLGVDVFFVISGFLITSHLMTVVPRDGVRGFGPFWLRRVRRLLPAALTVATLTLVGILLWMPQVLWPRSLGEVIASSLYVQNWALTASATDYFASQAAATPMQHYWSLSVEEQFYLVWPFVLLLSVLIPLFRRRSWGMALPIALVFVGSLAFSAWFTATSPEAAFFSTATRAWEFAAGGLLAATATLLPRLSAPVRDVIGWAGLGTIVASLFLISETAGIPGTITLIPVIGTVAVIAAGETGSRWSLSSVLGNRATVWVGDVSYSLYLWHWPLIVLWPFALGAELSTPTRLVVLVLSVVLAGLTRHFIEDPVRRSAYLTRGPSRRHLWVAAATAGVVLVSGIGLAVVNRAAESAATAVAVGEGDTCFAAAATAPGANCPDAHVLPSGDAALAASHDLAMAVTRGSICIQDRDVPELQRCEFGAPESEASLTVALVGDSHAGHWINALDVVAENRSWRVIEYMKSSCLGLVDPSVEPNWYTGGVASCQQWSRDLSAALVADPEIDAVVVSGIAREYLEVRDGTSGPIRPETVLATWQPWLDAGKQVVVLVDPPRWAEGDIPTCVSAAGLVDPCSVPASARDGDPYAAAVALAGDADLQLVDLNDHFCDEDRCHVAVGGVVAFGDGNHLTGTFSRSLGPYLDEAIRSLPRPLGVDQR